LQTTLETCKLLLRKKHLMTKKSLVQSNAWMIVHVTMFLTVEENQKSREHNEERLYRHQTVSNSINHIPSRRTLKIIVTSMIS
jgi:hypothetical protein